MDIIERARKLGYRISLTERGTILLEHFTAAIENIDGIAEEIKRRKKEIVAYLKEEAQKKENARVEEIQQNLDIQFEVANQKLKKEYPGGAFAWCYTNRPDLDKRINEVERVVSQAYKQADVKSFTEALDKYLATNREIFKAYLKGKEGLTHE